MDFAVVFFIEARNGAAPKLLGAHGGDVDEQKPAFDRSRFGPRAWRCFGFGCGIQNVFGAVHRSHSLARPPNPCRGRNRGLGGYAATSTLIVRGFASSRNGSFTVSTPFL